MDGVLHPEPWRRKSQRVITSPHAASAHPAIFFDVAYCAGFRSPGSRTIHAPERSATEKRQGTKSRDVGTAMQRALWGFGAGVSVGEVEPRLAMWSRWFESWACVLA